MRRSAVQSLWAEPRAPQPPARVWRDWVLVAALVPTALLEGVLRDGVAWRPVALALAVVPAFALLWRRTHPLAVVAVVFGAIIVVDAVAFVGGAGPVGLYTMAYILLLPYALFRWGSGGEAIIGLALVLAVGALGMANDWTGVVDAVVGTLFLLFPAALGASVRSFAGYRLREIDQVKLREREQLARELHDTVAHHVSAIAIQAQAGRTLAAVRPDAAADVLAAIESEAARALTEMRLMVGTLRGGEQPELAPPPGVGDIARLARADGEPPRVTVQLSGDLADLRPSVGAAVYRLAQESVTNAARHARNATRIDVRVTGDEESVRLSVADDGDAGPTVRDSSGYGLVGMTERAALLGGTLDAGPGAERGWTVNAVLPRAGSVR